MKSYLFHCKTMLGLLTLTMALTAHGQSKDLKVVCSAGTSNFDASSSSLKDENTHILTPKPPEPSLYRRAPEMSLNVADSLSRQDSQSKLQFVYRYRITQLWPEFNKQGVWNNQNITLTLDLDVLVQKIFANGTKELLGIASTKKHLNLDADGQFPDHQGRLSLSIAALKIYALAKSHPNSDVKDQEFPHSYFDVYQNAYLRDQIKNGQIPQDEFYETNFDCLLSYK